MYTERIRILIADNHPNVRAQMSARLKWEEDIEVIGESDYSRNICADLAGKHPDILLVDPIMRDGKGVELLREIKGKSPLVSVVVLTTFVDTALKIELQKVGVQRILAKGIDTKELIEVLRDVARHQMKTR
jgi:DNA-binding NarL/FixJ family response regulator